METLAGQRPMTQEAFMRLQKEGEGFEYEYGRLIPLMPVEGNQSSAWSDLYLYVGAHVKQNRLGRAWLDLLTYLDPEGNVRYFPDVVYLANDRLHQFDGRKVVGPPTLAVEVTTPDSDDAEEGRKKLNYHRVRVPWYWVVNTMRRWTEEYRWEEAVYVLVSRTPFEEVFQPALFPGLQIVLAEDSAPATTDLP